MTPEVTLIKEFFTLYGPLGAGWVAWYLSKKDLKEEQKEHKKTLREMYEREIEARDKETELKTALVGNLRGLRHLIKEALQ